MEPTMIAKFSEYGLVGLIIAVLFFIVWKQLMWVFTWVKDTDTQHAEERKCWQTTVERLNKSIDDHTSRANTFHEEVTEAHRFQREEHKEMIGQLNEITITLGRINGYKK